MPAYVIATIAITDPDAYDRYKPLALASLAPYGGRYLARGGKHRLVEQASGQAPAAGVSDAITRVVIAEFPSLAAIEAWYDGPEYRAARAARAGAADMTVMFVEGVARV